MTQKKGYIIGVVSPKGGVGKTVTSANLAVALTEFNKKVVVIDTNVTTASLGFHFNILYPEASIYDVTKKSFNVQWAIQHYNDHLDIIPASIVIEENDKDINKMHKHVSQVVKYYKKLLKKLVKEYDYVILDAAGGFSIEATATMKVADGILLVTNPEYPAVIATAKGSTYAKIMKVPMLGIVLARVQNKDFEIGEKQIEESLGVPIIAVIPQSENVQRSIAQKIPIVLLKPLCKVSIAYKKLAGTIIGEEYKLSFSERMKSWFQ